MTTPPELLLSEHFRDEVGRLFFSPDGSMIVASCFFGNIKLYNLEDLNNPYIFRTDKNSLLKFSPNSQLFLIIYLGDDLSDSEIYLYDVTNLQQGHVLNFSMNDDYCQCHFSSDNSRLVVNDRKLLRVYNLENRTLIKNISLGDPRSLGNDIIRFSPR